MKKTLISKLVSVLLIISLLFGAVSLINISSSAESSIKSISYSTEKKEINPEDHYDYDEFGDDELWSDYDGAFFSFPVTGDLLTVYYSNGESETYEYQEDYGPDEWSTTEYYWVNVSDNTKTLPYDAVSVSEIPYYDYEHNTTLTATYKNCSTTFDVIVHNQEEKVTKKATTSQDGQIKWYCDVCNKTFRSYVIDRIKKVSLTKTTFVYNGKVQKPNVKVYDSVGYELDKNIDFKLTYSKGCKNVGTYSVKITFIGKFYQGSITKTFKIIPKGTSLSKVTPAKKAFAAKWSRHGAITGYQIQYATNAKFSKAGIKTVKGATKYSLKVAKLKGGAKYYVRIRTYSTVGGKNYFSTWSKAKAVKTKK